MTPQQSDPRPKLVFVYSERSGPARRVDGYLAQVLQRRRNHATFDLVRVTAESQPELIEQLGVTELPTLLVIEEQTIQARISTPRGRSEIEAVLQPWLR